MLCILSGSQPFFRSPDDCTALAEITTIFGSKEVQKCAQKLGILTRIAKFITNYLFIEDLISFISLSYVNFFLFIYFFCLFNSGKKVIFSENLPGTDIISLCLRLKQRNKTVYDTENSIYKVYLVYTLNIFFYEVILQENLDIIID